MQHSEKQAAFLHAYLPIHTRLERYVRNMTRDEEEARDVTSDTILETYERFDGIREPGALLSFVFTVARRKLGRYRWRRRLFSSQPFVESMEPGDDGPSPDAAAEARLLRETLQRLPAAQREAVVLHELSDLPLLDVARLQGCSLASAKQRVHRGRQRLAVLLGVPVAAADAPAGIVAEQRPAGRGGRADAEPAALRNREE